MCSVILPALDPPNMGANRQADKDKAPVIDPNAFNGLTAADERNKATEKAKAAPGGGNVLSQEQEVGVLFVNEKHES